MNLSERLSRVARHVLPGVPMADVGTDHGQLPVWLVSQGVVPSAVAMDLRDGPLSVARRTCRRAGVGDVVVCRLSDGLAALKPGEAATVTICGMGGGLMAKILTAQPAVRESLTRLVLQPNTDAGTLRAALAGFSWRIIDEDLLIDGKYIYPVVVAEKSVVPVVMSPEDVAFGPVLRQRRPPAFFEMLRRYEAHTLRVLSQCGSSAQATARFEAELSQIRAEMQR